MSIFSSQPSSIDSNPLEGRRHPTFVRGLVLGLDPLRVRLWGDQDSIAVGLHAASYSPVVGDPVFLGRIGAKLVVIDKLEAG